jgi:hypothetical protein
MRDKEKSTDSRCRTCCYWSELIAKTHGGWLVAMCLAADGPRAWRYTRDDAGCPDWEKARDGAIDNPQNNELVRMDLPDKADPNLSCHNRTQ